MNSQRTSSPEEKVICTLIRTLCALVSAGEPTDSSGESGRLLSEISDSLDGISLEVQSVQSAVNQDHSLYDEFCGLYFLICSRSGTGWSKCLDLWLDLLMILESSPYYDEYYLDQTRFHIAVILCKLDQLDRAREFIMVRISSWANVSGNLRLFPDVRDQLFSVGLTDAPQSDSFRVDISTD